MSKRYVTVYDHTRQWGGEEEGGWGYSVDEYSYHYKCKSKRKAKKLCDRLNREFERERRYSPCSCDFSFATVERKYDIGIMDNTDRPIPRYC